MNEIPGPQFLRRVDPTRNMARFYILLLQPTLFGETSLVRQWGRIGTRGRQKVEYFTADHEAASALSMLAAQKMKRGYAGDDFDVAGGTRVRR
ncbi:WGR domain-containing protein [Neomesorhizobium albiziae]|nr:WGR domain-containing protein [Mesorhizobium albiziae]GLS28405.1 WGR domain-containing protein [Mesorhizobium albiziae]